jgi:hypothetical protein
MRSGFLRHGEKELARLRLRGYAVEHRFQPKKPASDDQAATPVAAAGCAGENEPSDGAVCGAGSARESAMLMKLVGDEMIRAHESGWPLNGLAALRDTLLRADVPADGGWRWEDFFSRPRLHRLRKGTLTYGPPRRHVCEDGVVSGDEWNRRYEARRAAVREANSTARR